MLFYIVLCYAIAYLRLLNYYSLLHLLLSATKYYQILCSELLWLATLLQSATKVLVVHLVTYYGLLQPATVALIENLSVYVVLLYIVEGRLWCLPVLPVL